MNRTLVSRMKSIIKEKGIPLASSVSAEVLNMKAPEGFRPADYFPEARSMLIFARPLPVAVYTMENDRKKFFHTAAFASSYKSFDEVSTMLCGLLEEAGFASVPVPSYSPLRFYGGKPRGLLSLKHSAAEAGMGWIGKNTIMINPGYGNILRLGGLLTTAELPFQGGVPLEKSCPGSCNKCIEACPVGALTESGIDKNRCMGYCIIHTFMPPRPVLSLMEMIGKRSRWMNSYLELFTLSFFGDYGVKCVACITACPHFPGKKVPKGGI